MRTTLHCCSYLRRSWSVRHWLLSNIGEFVCTQRLLNAVSSFFVDGLRGNGSHTNALAIINNEDTLPIGLKSKHVGSCHQDLASKEKAFCALDGNSQRCRIDIASVTPARAIVQKSCRCTCVGRYVLEHGHQLSEFLLGSQTHPWRTTCKLKIGGEKKVPLPGCCWRDFYWRIRDFTTRRDKRGDRLEEVTN